MDSFIKSETYYNLVSELEANSKFYNEPFSDYNLIGGVGVTIPKSIDIFHADNFFKALDKIRITTPDDEMDEYYRMISEVRFRVLIYVSNIPTGNKAREIFLSKYEVYVEKVERVSLTWGIDADIEEVYEMDDDHNVTSKLIKKRELLESWKAGDEIPKINGDERVLKEICKYFNTTRVLVNLERRYTGIDLMKVNRNLDLKLLAYILKQSKYIIPVQIQTFESLMSGVTFYEPLLWLGGMAELNKFIKALFSIGPRGDQKPKIEWKIIASIMLIDNAFQEAENIKGASSAKMESVQELKPFLSLVKSSLISK